MIDTHYHLDQLKTEELRDLLLEDLEWVVAPSMGYDSLMRLLAIKEKANDKVRVAAGFHPERPLTVDVRREVDRLLQWVESHSEDICAIGEIGLPYYSLEKKSPQEIPAMYWEILDDFLEVANTHKLPVILHAVHAMAEPCLQACQRKGIEKAVFHWLKAPEEVVKKIVRQGYHVSVTPEVCERERDQQLVRNVPISQLLLETDGPWELQGKYKGKLPRPAWILDSIHTIAEIVGSSVEEVKEKTEQNARSFFDVE